jgi:RNA polymerase sigma factor (sigma-70 family)
MKLKASLLDGCKNNSRAAQSEVYRLCYSEAMKIAMRYTQNSDEAKDILNKPFLKAFLNINEFKGDENNFFGWLKRIIINNALDHIRSISKKNETLGISEAFNEPFVQEHTFDSENIIHLIQRLPPRTSAVFNLFAIEGYNHKEIAEMLDISEANSKYHLHTARKNLQEWLFKTEKYVL